MIVVCTYFVSVHSENESGAGLYIVPSDSEAPLRLEALAKEGQRRELERLDNAKCLCLLLRLADIAMMQ